MAKSPFMAAINQIADEKGLSVDAVIETVEAAIAAAYRKDYGHPDEIIRASMTEDSEDIAMFQVYHVVPDEEFESEHNQMTLEEARKQNPGVQLGDEIVNPLETQREFGRIAAQTAKQVIIQRIREAEREMLYSEFKEKEHDVSTGTVQQLEGDLVYVNLGKMTALMMPSDQIPNEHYRVGQRVKVYVTGVEETQRGPRVIVSRTHPELVAKLFVQEVPEIQAGTVEIKAISREPGYRTKMAVFSSQDTVDPVGSCVGQRGSRVQAVLSELSEEKIDIILWDDDPIVFITNALSPAQVDNVQLFADLKKALVSVPEDQLSLAIGRAGQNVRLASRLTGWSIDIAKTGEEAEKLQEIQNMLAENKTVTEPEVAVVEGEEKPKKKRATKKETTESETKESKEEKPKKRTAKKKTEDTTK